MSLNSPKEGKNRLNPISSLTRRLVLAVLIGVPLVPQTAQSDLVSRGVKKIPIQNPIKECSNDIFKVITSSKNIFKQYEIVKYENMKMFKKQYLFDIKCNLEFIEDYQSLYVITYYMPENGMKQDFEKQKNTLNNIRKALTALVKHLEKIN